MLKEERLRFCIRNAKEEGFEEGFEQGTTQGIAQGTNQRNIEIVKKMLNENIDITMIEKITGLSNDEINNLK